MKALSYLTVIAFLLSGMVCVQVAAAPRKKSSEGKNVKLSSEEKRLIEENKKLSNKIVFDDIKPVLDPLRRLLPIPIDPPPKLSPAERAEIRRKIDKNNERLLILAQERTANEKLDRLALEDSLKSEDGNTQLGNETIVIRSVSITNPDAVSGTHIMGTCRYDAYGNANDTPPSMQVFLLFNNVVLDQTTRTSEGLMTGRNSASIRFRIPEDQNSGDYILRVEMTHGNCATSKDIPIRVRISQESQTDQTHEIR